MGPLENVPERVARLLGWNGEGGIHGAMKELQKASPKHLLRAQELLLGKEVIICRCFYLIVIFVSNSTIDRS